MCLFMSPASSVSFCVSGEAAGGRCTRGVTGASLWLMQGQQAALGSLLGLLGHKEAGAVPVLPRPALAQPTATALCQLLQRALAPHRNGGGPKARGLHALALLSVIPSPSSGGAAGTPWHRAGIGSACCTLSPSAFKTRCWTCLIHYVKPSKICKCFQPGNSVTRGFTPCFL